MQKVWYLLIIVLLAGSFGSCSIVQPILDGNKGTIKPGDKIGDITIEQSTEIPYQIIWYFCEIIEEYEPFSVVTECEVPSVSSLDIVLGWMAKESQLEPNWDAMTWEMYIDDYQIDLEAFDWFETEYLVKGENNKERAWIIRLKNLTPGAHTLRKLWKSKIDIDDGWNVYKHGTYQQVVEFTVLEKQAYPLFSADADSGQHPYTSEKAQLDFLFYLPNDYGKDPQQEWPLILYLHGAPYRGSTLELLTEEPLPRRLERETELPFIIVSPLGNGEDEFWNKDEMVNSLFTLLEEIKSLYSVNAKRIYLTGNDMGGNGVWGIGLRYPEYFAALAPISGYIGWPPEVPGNICELKGVPIWAFHGGRDDIIPVEAGQELVDALNACGGNAKYTISPDMKIDVQIKIYSEPDIYEWFLSQSLN